MKTLHKHIVMSSTYQQTSKDNARYSEKDPENIYYYKMDRRRLDLESFRDGLLQVSGVLDLTRGGRSIRFPNDRRTLYALVDRQNLAEIFKVFDFPNPNATAGQRFVSTVSQQSLFLLNSPRVMHAAEAMAKRVLAASQSNGERVGFAYCLAYSRPPTSVERQQVRDFFDRFTNAARRSDTLNEKPNRTAWIAFCQSLIAGSEFRYLD